MKKKNYKTSLRGKFVRHVIYVIHHLPVLGGLAQSGKLRQFLTNHEKKWICPRELRLQKIQMDGFTMEYLTLAGGDKRAIAGRDKRVILQLHGGGYRGRLHNTYRDMAVLYHKINGRCDVLSVDYRVATKNPYPHALHDAFTAYQWLLDYQYQPENIVVAGDSAGGGLAMALTMYLRDHNMPMPAAIVAMSPWTDLTLSGGSYQDNFDKDPMFGRGDAQILHGQGYVGDHNPREPYISPLFGDFQGFPPMLIQVGSREMLLDDSRQVYYKAKEVGVKVYLHVYSGMFHVFQMGGMLFPESRKAWKEVHRFLKKSKIPRETFR